MTTTWSGDFDVAQAYYTGAACTGSAFLNAGDPDASPISARLVVMLGSANTLAVPATVSNGVAPVQFLQALSIDNPSCGGSSGIQAGYPLRAVSRVEVGLPLVINGPLQLV